MKANHSKDDWAADLAFSRWAGPDRIVAADHQRKIDDLLSALEPAPQLTPTEAFAKRTLTLLCLLLLGFAGFFCAAYAALAL